ncbi:hypothetical protein ASPCAL15085 [Aspergillus calidoustus]|uniref:ferric-chelate reductase (NADPH) n=1 Tax=Aspergillus calidoustus TaxID=454130 RepID=A0A0U5GIP7_ASPCI|nr:hypothetical protein ASPCAL15057 [Aspergillus calidoustus]CEL11991.1 hypothetical protein ASPCAL15085 [Aspergillus calidoustus]
MFRLLLQSLGIGTGKKPANLEVVFEGPGLVRVRIGLPRPWRIRAGQRIQLSVPGIGLFYLFQLHPFAISWWQNDDAGKATFIYLLIGKRSGFTQKLADGAKSNGKYKAWIDGPYGVPSVGPGMDSENMGDYGRILMVATGIGIAAQLPYIKELLEGYRNKSIRTQEISIIWQLDEEGDWEGAHDWLQELVEGDGGFLLNVIVYDTLEPISSEKPSRFGEHDLIKVYSGFPSWEEQLLSAKPGENGRTLVAVSAKFSVRRKIRELVRANIRQNVELFEQEFQPWTRSRLWSYLTP